MNSSAATIAAKDDVGEVFRELLAAAGRGGAGTGTRRNDLSALARARDDGADHRSTPGRRMPRPGFDDVAEPLAVIGLDGRFRELNPAFAKLVGYLEHEFGKAMWPSVHDRTLYEAQQEQFEQLVRGELASVPVQSTYMHGQGLMVPVVGEISVVRGDDGQPSHLLLRAE